MDGSRNRRYYYHLSSHPRSFFVTVSSDLLLLLLFCFLILFYRYFFLFNSLFYFLFLFFVSLHSPNVRRICNNIRFFGLFSIFPMAIPARCTNVYGQFVCYVNGWLNCASRSIRLWIYIICIFRYYICSLTDISQNVY